MPRPLVSVVIPFYDTPTAFLREAIDSVFAQDYRDWELLLVDDGFLGESTQLALDVSSRHAGRVRYLEHPRHENRRLSASRTLGVEHAQGSYVAFLDSDDVWLPSKLTKQVALMGSTQRLRCCTATPNTGTAGAGARRTRGGSRAGNAYHRWRRPRPPPPTR